MKNHQTIKAIASGALLALSTSAIVWAKERPEPRINGSLPIAGTSQVDYPKLARISAADASRIANAQVPGGVLSVGLENEDGFLIYAVEVAGSHAGHHEVIVDAGNGRILSAIAKSKKDEGEQDDD